MKWPTQWGSELPDFGAYASLAFWTVGAVAAAVGAVALPMLALAPVAAVCALFAGLYVKNLVRRQRTLSPRIAATRVDSETGSPLADPHAPGAAATLIPGRPIINTASAVIATLLGLGFSYSYWSALVTAGSYPVMNVLWALVMTALSLFGLAYTARLFRNPRRIALAVSADTLWVHGVFSTRTIAWDDVTAVEPIGRPLAFLQTPWDRARERVTPRIEISHGDRTVQVHPLSYDIDPAVLLHLIQTFHTSPEARTETGDGRTVATLAQLYMDWDDEYR